ncbi:hypothetical protein P691DRAFT_727899 [Macrolepiota fuliginosa MF-IS2]|uniref:DUF6533 domain-containing protein n=1 Tax=Macrolepiota fuliginosa MF-IS2 TaxID=1400762 RepID=A0A9P5XDQ8_9AGAR|nr:hypothetical protein P691DRAFT_727899 [Macrolepiota fuliginosa MF-IS2]
MDADVAKIAASHLLAGKYFQLAAFVMLVYDHCLTFAQEVERIWKHRLSAAAVLFLVNRYATLAQFIIVLVAFHEPQWVGKRCSRFVLFEGMTTVGILAVGQLIMILRVYAIYDRSTRILVFLLMLWLAQIVISFVGLRTGYVAPLPKGLTGCILTGSDVLFPSVWIAPIITDSTIFLLTIYRTKHYLHHLLSPFMSEAAAKAIMILVRDGTMYFFLIMLSNLMNGLIFFLAPPDLKAIGASFSQLLTCTIISRLVLNLRSISRDGMHTTMEPGADEIAFYTPTCPDQEESGSSGFGMSRGGTTSFWKKALHSFSADPIYSIQSMNAHGMTGTRATGGVEVSTEIVQDIPMQPLDSPRRESVKGYPLV